MLWNSYPFASKCRRHHDPIPIDALFLPPTTALQVEVCQPADRRGGREGLGCALIGVGLCGRSEDVFSLGVADGVYMWATQGIDAGEFARSLMQTAKHTVEAGATADVLNGSAAALPLLSMNHQVGHSGKITWKPLRSGGSGEQLTAARLVNKTSKSYDWALYELQSRSAPAIHLDRVL